MVLCLEARPAPCSQWWPSYVFEPGREEVESRAQSRRDISVGCQRQSVARRPLPLEQAAVRGCIRHTKQALAIGGLDFNGRGSQLKARSATSHHTFRRPASFVLPALARSVFWSSGLVILFSQPSGTTHSFSRRQVPFSTSEEGLGLGREGTSIRAIDLKR